MRYKLERALTILRLLQSGKKFDPLKLCRELNVHRRTVYRDIARLREMGISVQFDSDFGGYVIDGVALNVGRDGQQSELSRLMCDAIDRFQEQSAEKAIREVANVIDRAGTIDKHSQPVDNELQAFEEDSRGGSGPELIWAAGSSLSSLSRFQDDPRQSDEEAGAHRHQHATDATASEKNQHATDHFGAWVDARQSLHLIVSAIDSNSQLIVRSADPDTHRLRSGIAIRPSRVEVSRQEVAVFFYDGAGGATEKRLSINLMRVPIIQSIDYRSPNDRNLSTSNE